jgi:hypothetical protein
MRDRSPPATWRAKAADKWRPQAANIKVRVLAEQLLADIGHSTTTTRCPHAQCSTNYC